MERSHINWSDNFITGYASQLYSFSQDGRQVDRPRSTLRKTVGGSVGFSRSPREEMKRISAAIYDDV